MLPIYLTLSKPIMKQKKALLKKLFKCLPTPAKYEKQRGSLQTLDDTVVPSEAEIYSVSTLCSVV